MVNHEILQRKLYAYDVRGIAHEWFRSYSTDRKQRVKIGSTFSDFINVSIGVPQGCVLGSLLFLVYINELPKVEPHVHCVLFADETCITLSDKNMKILLTTLIESCQNLVIVFIQNGQSLNNEKKKHSHLFL